MGGILIEKEKKKKRERETKIADCLQVVRDGPKLTRF